MKHILVLLAMFAAILLFAVGCSNTQKPADGRDAAAASEAPHAHMQENHNGDSGYHDHGMHHKPACDGTFVLKGKAAVPDLSDDNYREIRTLEWDTGRVIFTYVFYADLRSPGDVKVMTVRPAGAPLTRMTWQEGDAMKTVRLEVDEMVCVKPVVVKGGKKLDLADLMHVLIRAEENAK